MLMGLPGFFAGERFRLFKNAGGAEVLLLNRRVVYFRDYNDSKPRATPPYESAWVCKGVLPTRLEFGTMPLADNLTA